MSRSPAHDARNQALREGLGDVSGTRAAATPTKDVVTAECQRLGLALKTEDVPDSEGARIHWIGDPSPQSVILYFHGHVMFLEQTQQKLAAEGKTFAIAFLEYVLTPQYKFPIQHMQIVQALKHVLHSGRKPSDVIVGGDSAGGNLVLGVLSATAHSHKGIPALELETPLKGALLISPWTSYSSDTKSYTENADKDIVTAHTMYTLRDDFIPSELKDEFAEPDLADANWWKNVQVSSVLNLAGGHELFLDYIISLGSRMKEAGLNAKTVECPQQVHIDCVLDAQTAFEPGPMSLAAWDWLAKTL